MEMCYQVACGLEHLKDLGLVHRDIAARNCVISSQLVVKISMLSLSQEGFPEWVIRQSRFSEQQMIHILLTEITIAKNKEESFHSAGCLLKLFFPTTLVSNLTCGHSAWHVGKFSLQGLTRIVTSVTISWLQVGVMSWQPPRNANRFSPQLSTLIISHLSSCRLSKHPSE